MKLILAPLVLALGSLAAQEEGRGLGKSEQQGQQQGQVRPEPRHQEAGRQVPDNKASPDGDAATFETGEGGKPAIVEAVSHLCSVRAMITPARIAPGQSGTLCLVLALQGSAVIVPGSTMTIKYESPQGNAKELDLGAWQIKPPSTGTLEAKFKGQPVYDNNAQVDIPVAVAANAAHGKYPVTLQLEVGLTDGKTGGPIGSFKSDVRAEVVVGPSLPRPNVVLPRKGSSAKSEAPNVTERSAAAKAASTGAPTADAPGGERVSGGTLGQLPAGQQGSEATLADDAEPSAPAAPFPVVLIGAGVAVIALLALLLARKRSN